MRRSDYEQLEKFGSHAGEPGKQGHDISPGPTGRPDGNLEVLESLPGLRPWIGGIGDLLRRVPAHLTGHVYRSFSDRGA